LGRKIRISYPDDKVSAVAELSEDDAPKTSEAVWNLLPIKAEAVHDIWSGHVVFFFLEPTRIIEYENVSRILDVNPGDLFYYYRAPHFFRGAPYGKAEASEIGIVYDRDSQPWGPRGAKGVNIFGQIIENLDGFARVCERMIWEGSKTIVIEKT
jgi:hypothetical protein